MKQSGWKTVVGEPAGLSEVGREESQGSTTGGKKERVGT